MQRNDYPFNRECWLARRVLSQLHTGLSDSWLLSSKAFYRTVIKRSVWDDLISELYVIKEYNSYWWPWAPVIKCLNNEEASLTCVVIRGPLWVGKKPFTARLAISPEFIRWNNVKEWIWHLFFSPPNTASSLKSTWFAWWMLTLLPWKPILCAAIALLLNRSLHNTFLCLLGIIWVVIWTTRWMGFHKGETFSSQTRVAFYMYQTKIKILSEKKKRLCPGVWQNDGWNICECVTWQDQPNIPVEYCRLKKNGAFLEQQKQTFPGKLA